MEALAEYGEEDWFRLGDRDFATHIARTAARDPRRREPPSARPTDGRALAPGRARHPDPDPADGRRAGPDPGPRRRRLARLPGVLRPSPARPRGPRGPVRRRPRDRHRPSRTRSPRPRSSSSGRRTRSSRSARSSPDRSGDLVTARAAAGIPVVAVSPIVGGVALKGPADRMLVSLGHESSARGVARIYQDIATAFVLDTVDAALEPEIAALGFRTLVTDTIMADHAGRARLARAVLEFAAGTRTGAEPAPRDPDRGDHPGRHARGRQDAARRDARCRGAARARRGVAGTDRGGRPGRRLASTTSWWSARTARSCGARRRLGARTLRQRSRGLNAGLARGTRPMWSRGARPRSSFCRSICRSSRPRRSRWSWRRSSASPRPATARPGPTVVLSPTGTAPAPTPSASGHPTSSTSPSGRDSRRAHRAAALNAGAAYDRARWALTVDLDTADDLVFVESVDVGPRAVSMSADSSMPADAPIRILALDGIPEIRDRRRPRRLHRQRHPANAAAPCRSATTTCSSSPRRSCPRPRAPSST